jgi:hypothetical protein
MLKKLLILLMIAILTACQTVNTTSGGRVGVNRTQWMFSGLSEMQVQTSAATAYQQEIIKAQQQDMLNRDKKTVCSGQIDRKSANSTHGNFPSRCA